MKLLTILSALLLSFSVFAESVPSMAYECGGIRQVADEPAEQIAFNVIYANFVKGVGYSEQLMVFTMPEPDTIQISELREAAEKSPECFEFTELEVQKTEKGFEFYKFAFTNKCEVELSVLGYCSKQ